MPCRQYRGHGHHAPGGLSPTPAVDGRPDEDHQTGSDPVVDMPGRKSVLQALGHGYEMVLSSRNPIQLAVGAHAQTLPEGRDKYRLCSKLTDSQQESRTIAFSTSPQAAMPRQGGAYRFWRPREVSGPSSSYSHPAETGLAPGP